MAAWMEARMPDAQPLTDLSAAIDRHLDRGRRLFHAPITADRLPVVRDFIAAGEALVLRADVAGRARAPQVQRLRSLHRAFADRLRTTAPRPS
jgi:hypothetical protein